MANALFYDDKICCICRAPFTDPFTTVTCAHTFCKDCILRAIEHSAQCPVDRSPLSSTELEPANPIVRSLVDELVVECPHRAAGCRYTCQRQLLSAHLLDSCEYRTELRSEDKRDEGDGLSFVDESTDSLLSSSSSTPIETPTRLAALTEQNILLRRRVETVESLLHSFRREMSAVRCALGPWFRVGESMAPPNNSSPLEPPPSQRSISTSLASTGDHQLGNHSPYAHHHHHQHQHSFSPLFDSLAPYFPAELDESLQRNNNIRRPRSESVDLTQPYEVHMAHNSPFAPPVAPLNLSTTLEGSLHGLRESMVMLATSVDSLSRRQDIALKNETTRMAEELGALRAGVHGLRMQVHAIMMDRNAQLTGRDGVGDSGLGQWMPPLPVPPPQPRPFYPQPASITKL